MKSLSQIAKELGVSNAAVSYVYNNKWRENRINEKLAQKISRKIEEENATPDALGRQLRTGRTYTIGVILADLERRYNLSILAGIEKKIASTDNLVLLGNSQLGRKEDHFLNTMLSRKVDGLIICPMYNEKSKERLFEINKDIPLVLIDNYYPDLKIPFVTSDNKWGAYMAVKRLLDTAGKRVVYRGGNPKTAVSQERFAGYKQALSEAGLECDDELYMSATPLDEIERLPEKTNALFSESFIYFENFFKRFIEDKREDIALCGFDEPNFSSGKVNIPFLRQRAELMGETAASFLLKQINGDRGFVSSFIKPELTWETS